MSILTILILPTQEHIIYFYFFVSISFINVLLFSEYRSFTSLLSLLLDILFFFDAILNKIFFLTDSFFLSFFLWSHLRHTEVPGLGVKLELQLQATATATTMPDPSHICDLRCSLWQCQILNPLSEVRDQTRILIDTILGS